METKFTKGELKTGMILKIRNEGIGMVMLGTSHGDVVAGDNREENQVWFPLNDRTDDSLFGENGDCEAVYDFEFNRNIDRAEINIKNFKLIWNRATLTNSNP